MAPTRRHRRCVVLRGDRDATLAASRAICARLDRTLHVTTASDARSVLGGAYQAVVLDLHDGLDPDLLGMCHGLVHGGGALVLRMPEDGPPGDPRLAVFPHAPEAVGRRFARRFERHLARLDTTPRPVAPCDPPEARSAEQDAVVRHLRAFFDGPPGGLVTLLADRGRGKSSALGLAAATLRGARAVVTSAHPGAVEEVRRRAPDLPWVPADALDPDDAYDVLLVDEAAMIPLPLLQHVVRAHPSARIALATTTRGYEGTGRGFALRFLPWLRGLGRPLAELTLDEPLRWAPDDPVERLVEDVLALDARPAPVATLGTLRAARLDRDALALDEERLRQVFGLLVHAHYRTTAGDLQRLLDAPNVDVHVLFSDDQVVAASIVAHEGGLPPDRARRMRRGEERIRGHALPDTLVCHAGAEQAGSLRMVRSVRLAVHPDHRRTGLGRRLVEHVHATYAPDLFGTVFAARPDVLRFRRELGYELVRLGTSRGARTGEPAAVMIRPVGEAARALAADLRRGLARELPVQLALLEADGSVPLDPELVRALLADLPDPGPVTEAEREEVVRSWVYGTRPYEAAAWAVEDLVRARADRVRALPSRDRDLIRARVLERTAWRTIAREQHPEGVRSAMRALRSAVARLL